MSTPEFSRTVKLRHLPPDTLRIEADEAEREALARRFAIVKIRTLEAEIDFDRDGAQVEARGTIRAALVQNCAVSGEDFDSEVETPFALRFVPRDAPPEEEEVEIDAETCDEIEYGGEAIDIGEAVAQTLSLAIDPYATGPGAESVREKHGLLDEDRSGPFAALAALRKDKE